MQSHDDSPARARFVRFPGGLAGASGGESFNKLKKLSFFRPLTARGGFWSFC